MVLRLKLNGCEEEIDVLRQTFDAVCSSSSIIVDIPASALDESTQLHALHIVGILRGLVRLWILDFDVPVELQLEEARSVEDDCSWHLAPPNDAAVWLLIALASAPVADVLKRIGEGVWWDDMASVIATVSTDLGSRELLAKRGWASERELARLIPLHVDAPLSRGIEAIALRVARRWLEHLSRIEIEKRR
jgi:hypothetical protein